MGNICRSPSAEGILLKKVQEKGLENNFLIDSCGTHGYHEGQGPDQRSIEAALERGIDIRNQISRLVVNSDFETLIILFQWTIVIWILLNKFLTQSIITN